MSHGIQELIGDAAVEIYNLGIATTDKPAHERYGLIVRVICRLVVEVLRQQRERLLKNSSN